MLRGGDLWAIVSNVVLKRKLTVENVHVVDKTRNGLHLSGSLLGLPNTDKLDKEVVTEARVEHLADEEDVGRESRLEHNGHVGSVEEADGV